MARKLEKTGHAWFRATIKRIHVLPGFYVCNRLPSVINVHYHNYRQLPYLSMKTYETGYRSLLIFLIVLPQTDKKIRRNSKQSSIFGTSCIMLISYGYWRLGILLVTHVLSSFADETLKCDRNSPHNIFDNMYAILMRYTL